MGNVRDGNGVLGIMSPGCLNCPPSPPPPTTSSPASVTSATLTGHAEGHAGLTQGLMEVTNSLNLNPIIDFHPNYKVIQNKTELMQSGYSYDFKDPPGSGGNQARHFWFYVQVSYESGHRIGISANYLHETIVNNGSGKSVQDYALGIEGLILGESLASGNIKPGGVGSWIDRTLAPRLTDGEKK